MIRLIKKIIGTINLIIIVVIGLLVYSGYDMYKEAINEMPLDKKVASIKKDVEDYTYYKDLPQNYINAVIAVEDKSFFTHHGVNLISIGRAVITDIKTKSLAEGGSTITQQIAKNVYFTQEKKFTRKIAEVFMAFEIEKEYSKEEIFELYVNTIYFGDGYYNISDACKGYFDKDVSELDLYEATLIAGVPNAPSVYSPTKNPELCKERQAQVLYKMVKYKYLTQEEADMINEHK